MFDSLSQLMYNVGTKLLTLSIKKILLGAGLALVTYEGVTKLLDKLIADANANLSNGDGEILSLIGLSGADTAISVILSACVLRATIASTSVVVSKFE